MRRVFTKNELEEYAAFAHGVEGDMAKTILAERAEREKNPGVWDDAPDNAIIAKVHFYKADKVYARTDGIPTVYTRTLPKTKAREIAERKAREWANGSKSSAYVDGLSEHIESAINEALAGGGK